MKTFAWITTQSLEWATLMPTGSYIGEAKPHKLLTTNSNQAAGVNSKRYDRERKIE